MTSVRAASAMRSAAVVAGAPHEIPSCRGSLHKNLSYARTARNSCARHRRIRYTKADYSRDIRRSCQSCCCRTPGPSSFPDSELTDSRVAPA
jgi:hypothetical protein